MHTMLKTAVVAAALAFAGTAQAAFTVTNTAGGNGSVAAGPAPYLFTLTGSDDGTDDNVLLYSDVAVAAGTFSGSFLFTTFDVDGASFDPAGYFVNSVFTQLSDDDLDFGQSNSGTFSFAFGAGDTYGFYIDSTDGTFGPSTLSIGAVPEPATWGLMIVGFGLVGVAARRRKAAFAA